MHEIIRGLLFKLERPPQLVKLWHDKSEVHNLTNLSPQTESKFISDCFPEQLFFKIRSKDFEQSLA